MTVVVVAGNELGLQDATLKAQGRQDLLGNVGLDNGSGLFINVATGNLVYTHQDSFLPSRGQDFDLIRTYNSRGTSGDPGEANDARWTLSTSITLKERNNGGQTYYEVRYGDGAVFEYYLDQASGQYVTTDGEGAYEVLNLVYSKNGKSVEGYEVVRADRSTLRFDKLGNLTKWTDANGVYMEFSYQSNRLVRVQDDTGHTVNYNYAKGVLASISSESATGERNTLVEYRYSQGRLSEVIDREGHVTRYYYTNNGYLERIELPAEQGGETFDARSITFTYASVNTTGGQGDNTPLIASITNAEGETTEFSYDFVGSSGKGRNDVNFYGGGTTTVTDARGNRLVYTYDDRGNITEVLDQDGNATTYIYDDQDNLLSITDRRGNSTSFTYDGRGNLLSKTDAEGNTTTYTYTEFNKIASITEANQADAANPLSITFAYDDNFNLIRQTSALGDVTKYEYDDFGNLVREVAELYDADRNIIGEQETLYLYDRFGNNTGTETVVGGGEAAIITGSEYDIFGNRTSFTDGNGQTTQFIYDNDNRLLQTIDPLNRITTYSYDAVGNVITLTAANGLQTVNVYDKNNNLLTTTELGDNAEQRMVTREYDVVGNVTAVVDAKGRREEYNYNARNELVTITTAGVTDVDGESLGSYVTTYQHDKEGNVTRIVNNLGAATEFSFDGNGQLISEISAVGHTIQYYYDANLNLISVVAGVQRSEPERQKTTYVYDAGNRLIEETDAEGNTTRYQYDAVGNLSSLTDARGNTTSYQYDLANRLIREYLPESDDAGAPYYTEYGFDANGNQVSVRDANGNQTQIIYDAVNRTSEIIDANGVSTAYVYDEGDNLLSVSILERSSDADTSTVTYAYNKFDELIKETDAVGNALASSDALLYQELRVAHGFNRESGTLSDSDKAAIRALYTTKYSYDLIGNLVKVVDKQGRVNENTYDELNRLVREVIAKGTDVEATRSYFYDGANNLTREVDPLSRVTEYSYDAVNRLVSQRDADGYITRIEYDDFSNTSAQITADGTGYARRSEFIYDLNNRLLTVADPRGAETNYRYDEVGNRVEVVDARGNRSVFEYDALSRLIVSRDPNSFETRFKYDGVGNQVSVTDPRGAVTNMLYDPGNRQVRMTDGEGRVTDFVYDALGNQISVTTASGTSEHQTTLFHYDAESNLRAVTDADGNEVAYQYDQVFNQTAIIDANGNRTDIELDARNRVVKITDAEGGVTQYILDAVGNTLEIIDANNNSRLFEYDAANKLISEQDPLGVRTEYSYDPDRELGQVTRAAGTALEQITRFFYDGNGNVVEEVNAEGGVQRFTFDENNNLIVKTDENGTQTRYVYDALNRVSGIVEGLAPGDDLTKSLAAYRLDGSSVTEYRYDGNDNRTAVIDGNGNETLFYFNAVNEQVAVVDALGYMTSYSYDANGNIRSETRYANSILSASTIADFGIPEVVADPQFDRTTLFEYDRLNRLVKETDPEGASERYEYDAAGNLVKLTDRNGNSTSYVFDKLNRVLETTDAMLGVSSTTYDALGNALTFSDQLGRTKYFLYDALNRITAESDLYSGRGVEFQDYEAVWSDPTTVRQTYSYDGIGNLTAQTDQNSNSTRFEYDRMNRLVSVIDAAGNETKSEYDAVGNLIRVVGANQQGKPEESQQGTDYRYDSLNRVVEIIDPEGRTQSYAYDAASNVIQSIDQQGTKSYFDYDLNNRLTSESVVEGVGPNQTEILATTTSGYNAFGDLINQTDAAGVERTQDFDRNGRVVESDEFGVIKQFSYDAAGNLIREVRAGNRETLYTYDALNRLNKVVDPLDGERRLVYDAVGNVLQKAEENGNLEYKAYDDNNRLVSLMTREGFITLFYYDQAGNEIRREQYQKRYELDSDGSIPTPNPDSDEPQVFVSTFTVLNQLLSETEPNGLTKEYEYDREGNLLNIVEYSGARPLAFSVSGAIQTSATIQSSATGNSPAVTRASVQYNAANEVISRVDANGVETLFVRDEITGQLVSKIEAAGTEAERTTTYEYSRRGFLERETRANGLVITYAYDKAGKITFETRSGDGAQDRTTQYIYDSVSGRLFQEVDGVGNRKQYAYDAAGNTISETYAVGTSYQYSIYFEYDEKDQLIAEVDGEGVRTEYGYDARGNKVLTRQAVGVAGQERLATYTYDQQDRLTAITDTLGATTRYYYDEKGNQTVILRADGTATLNTFNEMGWILTNTVGAAVVTPAGDGNAAVVFTAPTGGIRTTNTYDDRGNVLSSTVGFADGSGAQRVSQYTWDNLDQMLSLTDPEGYTSLFSYDAFGNKTSLITGAYLLQPDDAAYDAEKAGWAQPQASLFVYDNADRLVESISATGNLVRNTYNVFGDKTSTTTGLTLTDAVTMGDIVIAPSSDAVHVSTTNFEYDSAGRMIAKTSDEGINIQITLDVLGRQTSVRTLQSDNNTEQVSDDVWSTVTSEYDTKGRLTRETDAEGSISVYGYDALGKTTSITRAFGTADARTTTATYDLMGRLASRSDGEGAVTQYLYDSVGNLIQVIDAQGGISRRYYNEFNFLIAEVNPTGSLTSYQRDAFGNAIRVVQYANTVAPMDDYSVPVPTASAGDRWLEQTFNGNDKRVSETQKNGAQKLFIFDSAGLLIQQISKAATDTDLTSRTTDTSDRILSWQWDVSGRLMGFTNSDGTVETYTYDSSGNKRTEQVHNPAALANGENDLVRLTVFEYDRDNRLIAQTSGTNIQILSYDNAGNVVAKTDGRGNSTTSIYDRNNRLLGFTDAAGYTVSYTYDRVGNLLSVVDAENHRTDYTYDRNNRLLSETGPSLDLYQLDPANPGLPPVTGRATATNRYDNLGRLIERTDAAGNVVSRWYNASGLMIAEIDGNNVVRRYSYSAFGELLSTDTARDFLTGPRPDPETQSSPELIAGGFVTISNIYDDFGRVVQTNYPAIQLTTLSSSGEGTSANTSNAFTVVSDQSLYDAWGNLVESVDRAGARTYAFFDVLGRTIATVDADGYLVRTAYDSQGNVVSQKKFEEPVSSVSSGVLPETDNSAEYIEVLRFYSVENYLLREISAEIQLNRTTVARNTTTYTYDAAGNQTSKTRASGTSESQTEYYYFNEVNRRVAVVSAGLTLSTFAYDGNGNTVSQRQYSDSIDISISSSTAITSIIADVDSNNSSDLIRFFEYNGLGKLARQTDVMTQNELSGSGNRVTQYYYDGVGNLTKKVDPSGNVSELLHDAAGRVTLSISPNGAYSFIEYNTLGLKTRAWTGGNPSSKAPTATFSNDARVTVTGGNEGALSIGWTLSDESQPGTTSWIAWSTTSNANLGNDIPSSAPGGRENDRYQNASEASQDNRTGFIALAELTADQTVYYRVVVKDSLGNLSWTEERSVAVPVTVSSVVVEKLDDNRYLISAQFSDGETSGRMLSLNNEPAQSLVNGTITLTVADPANATIAFSGTSASGVAFSTSAQNVFLGGGGTETIEGWRQWTIPSDESGLIGNGQLVLIDGVRIASEVYRSNNTLQVNLPDGSTGKQYDLFYGDVFGQENTLKLSYNDGQVADFTNRQYIRDDDDEIVETRYTKTWRSNGNNLIGVEASVTFDSTEIAQIGAAPLYVAYRPAGTGSFGDALSMTRNSGTNRYTSEQKILSSETDYDVKVFYTDQDGNEVIVQWARVTTAAESQSSSAGTVSFSGQNDNPSESRVVSGYDESDPIIASSITVLASEIEGTITAAGTNPGKVSGPADVSDFAISRATGAAGSDGEYRLGLLPSDDASLRPYYTEIVYNDLGYVIASNENDGLWRAYGIDAMGNRVETTLLGDRRDLLGSYRDTGSGIVTYTHFDNRGNAISAIGPEYTAGRRSVTNKWYDYDGRLIRVQDPGNEYNEAREFHYDGVGNLVAERDELGGYTRHDYDLLGNRIATTDAAGHRQIFRYDYRGRNSNRLVETYYAGLAASTRQTYDYDAFGRRTSVTKGDANNAESSATTRVYYNQAGEISQVTSATGKNTHYWYDANGNQVWVKDANNNYFGKRYNEMGKLTHEYSFARNENGSVGRTLQEITAAVVNNDASLIVRETVYDIYSNAITTISAEGKRTNRTYGAFGRLLSSGDLTFTYDDYGRRVGESSNSVLFEALSAIYAIFGLEPPEIGRRNITREYSEAGQLTRVRDITTGVETTYTYDGRGNRLTEELRINSALKRNITYTYLANGDLASWNDAVPNLGQTFTYFADGNVREITGSGGATYSYDAANRITRAGSTNYQYNYLGLASNEGGTSYTYDKAGWLTAAGSQTWTYDQVGNVLTRNDGAGTYETNTYDYAYRITVTDKTEPDGPDEDDTDPEVSKSTTNFDKDGNITSTVNVLNGKTTSYSYSYDSRGLVTSITGSGPDSASGTSTSIYDVNGQVTQIKLGSGDNEDAIKDKSFVYDNDGKIIQRTFTSDGDNDDKGTVFYLYQNGQAAGQYKRSLGAVGSVTSIQMNTGNYDVFSKQGPGYAENTDQNPASSITQYTAQGGETLRQLAAQYYGSPDLWYVIAEANGLTGAEPLSQGVRIVVPNSANNVYQTAETNALYKEGDIVGSKLPNLTTPPPEEDECKKIGAIILIVVVAIAAIALTIVTVGAAAPAAAAAATAIGAGTAGALLAGAVVGAVIGAAIAFAASAITQGILVGFGLQKDFDWNAVLADTVAGAFGGAAAGLGSVVAAGKAVSTVAKVVNVVGQVALESAGEAASQAIQNNGRIDSPWLVVAAAGGGLLGGVSDVASASKKAAKVSELAADSGDLFRDTSQKSIKRVVGPLTADAQKFTEASTAGLNFTQDVAAAARKAGKGKFGVALDVFSAEYALRRGNKFTQKLGKGGVDSAADIADGKKLVRVLEVNQRTGAIAADYRTLDRLSSTGKNFAGRVDAFKAGIESSAKSFKAGIKSSAKSFKTNVTDAFLNLTKGKSEKFGPSVKVTTSFKNGKKVTKTVFRESYKGTSKLARLSSAAGSIRDAAKTAVLGGTLGKFKDTKTIKVFVDGKAVTKVVPRVGQSKISRIGQAALRGLGAASGAAASAAKNAGKAVVNTANDAKKAVLKSLADFRDETIIPELKRLKFEKQDTLDTVANLFLAKSKKLNDSAKVKTLYRNGQEVTEIVLRDSFKGTSFFRGASKLEKLKNTPRQFADFLLTKARGGTLEKFKDTKTIKFFVNGKAVTKTVPRARSAGTQIFEGVKFSEKVFSPNAGSLAGALESGVKKFKAFEAERQRERDPTFRTNEKRLSKLSFSTFTKDRAAGRDLLTLLQGGSLNELESFRTGTEERRAYLNANARSTYVSDYSKQHSYQPLQWTQVAANTTSLVFSPLPQDRGASVDSILSGNKMMSGQVSGFSAEAIIAHAERTVGGIGTDPFADPLSLG